jgi:hypothetical protein
MASSRFIQAGPERLALVRPAAFFSGRQSGFNRERQFT